MSMIGNFRRVPTRVVHELRADPTRIKKVLYPERTETVIDDDVIVDIDKAWNGLHFLLTGDAVGEATGPLSFILGGEPIGDIDVGYGPARGFTADEVRAIATALGPITPDTLRARFDAKAFAAEDIYPGIWDEGEEALTYLLDHFESLKDFVLTTANAQAGMLVYLN